MFVTWKNTITKVVQIHNGFNGLTGKFTLLEFVVGTVALIVTKFPDGMYGVDEGSKGAKNTKFINHFWVEVVNKEFILKMMPMNGTKTFQKIWPSKIGLALTQNLVIMGKLVKWKWSGMKDAQKSFDKNVTEDRIVAVSIKVGPKILQ